MSDLSAEAQRAKAEAQSGTGAARDKTPDFAFAPSGLRSSLTFELHRPLQARRFIALASTTSPATRWLPQRSPTPFFPI